MPFHAHALVAIRVISNSGEKCAPLARPGPKNIALMTDRIVWEHIFKPRLFFPFLLGLLISSPVYIDEHWLWYQRPDRFFLQFRRHRIFRRFRTLFLWISFCIILLKIG